MRKLAFGLVLVAVLSMLAAPALALNPQSQGRGRQAVPGGTSDMIIFGPYTSQSKMPTGYAVHSGDEAEFWYGTYYMVGTTITHEPVAVKVPRSTTIVAPDLLQIGSNLYHYFSVNASLVAATDSVFFDPMFGGIGK